MDYKKLLQTSEYDFLRTNPYLGNHILLLTLGGSRAYGTNLPTSDVDIRGIAATPMSALFGLEKDFEQVVETNTDTVIYSMQKMLQLLISCNPNTIEILGCKPEHYLYLSAEGQMILNHANDFLSVRAIDTFGGYADAQYNRLEHGLLGNGENDDKKLQMLKDSLSRAMESFRAMHNDEHIFLDIKQVSTEEFYCIYPYRELLDDVSNDHLLLSGEFTDVPITDFKAMISQVHKIQSEYGNINKRNTKKTDTKLAKHMMHLVRLYLMGKDLNASGQIITYREKEHDILMSIRNGEYMAEDGKKVRPEFYDLLKSVQDEYIYAVKHTVLPERANMESLQEMMFGIYEKQFDRYKKKDFYNYLDQL